MHYIIKQICEIIATKEPAPQDEAIILVNGFEQLRYYVELANAIETSYKDSRYSINIKLAKRKWDKLSNSDAKTQDIQLMRQNGWIADKESVTFYRNQHNVDILVLLGTEDEEDTGGLANCFKITPESLMSDLGGDYHRIFSKCFTYKITSNDEQCIDKAYKCLFEYVPVNICKLSDLADAWEETFGTINEFCEAFGKNLLAWGLPSRELVPLKPADFTRTRNILLGEKDFISGKYFQRLSYKKYVDLQKKVKEYPSTSNMMATTGIDWASYGFEDYDEFSNTLLEFARGENFSVNKEKLLNIDYSIIDDILGRKVSGQTYGKTTDTIVVGEPLYVMLSTALTMLQEVKKNGKEEVSEICFCFKDASIVTGYTDADDLEKKEVLTDSWKNICVHVNGIFEFINQDEWKVFGKPVNITCTTPHFFDPQNDDIDNIVTVATGTNTLNKITFDVSAKDIKGNLLRSDSDGIQKSMKYNYVWKFSSEAAWLYDFKDVVFDDAINAIGSQSVPIGVMKRTENTTVITSSEEFFDIYGEESVDLSYDLTKRINIRLKDDDYDMKLFSASFSKLGESFCNVIQDIAKNGFYTCLNGKTISEFCDQYIKIADTILQFKFNENQEWIKDAFLQAFTILNSANYIENEADPKCVIIPPWHPAALQKIADQKRFLIDGLSQRIAEADTVNSTIKAVKLLERFKRMTEIQSTIDVFPASGNDYMGVLGTFGNFCVYGDEKNKIAVRTHVKDILRKEVIYDEEFKASELLQMNDDAQMLYDVFKDYNKAMPSVQCSLKIVFLNPPELQPIISAISKYVKDIRENNETVAINMELSILVRPENKGGKNYLTYWMDEYFAEDKNTNVRIYMNEWSDSKDLNKLLPDNCDIIFDTDLLHAESFHFIANPGSLKSKVTDCRFPIVYKPSPLSKTSTKRKIELTQPQFSVAYKYSQVVRYKKNFEHVPEDEEYLAVRETVVDDETKHIINMLHTKAYWVVCIDKVMDGALLRGKDAETPYDIIGFSTGKGMYGQYNLTITARNSILKTVEKKMENRLKQLFKWKDEDIHTAVQMVVKEARGLDGISMLSAVSKRSTNIHEFLAYVMTSLREKQLAPNSALKVIIHLDSYKHWFNNSDIDDDSKRPDFLLLSVVSVDETLKLKAEILECKTALYKNADEHINKALTQVQHGLKQLKRLFDPCSISIERRYWYAQLYRALVFAQVTFSDKSDEFINLSAKLREILDGKFEIEWSGHVLGYWIDMPGDKETDYEDDGIIVSNIPQQRIQELLLGSNQTEFVNIDDDVLITVEDGSEEKLEKEAKDEIKREREEIIHRRKVIDSKSQTETNRNPDHISVDLTKNTAEHTGEMANVESKKPNMDYLTDMQRSNQTEVREPSILSQNALEQVRVLIGKDRSKNDVYWEFGNKELTNRHLLITGSSGSGKTYCIQTMMYELSKTNISMVVYDYTEGYRRDQLEKKFVDKMEGRIDEKVIYFTGVPINPFKRYEIEIAGTKALEKVADVAQRVASILTHVYDFGEQQFAAIFEACSNGLQKYADRMDMKHLKDELEQSSNKAAKTVVSKMLPFFGSVDFSEEQCDWENILYNPSGNLTIFQLTNFSRDIQVIITEFMLWDMWHFTKKSGNKDKPFAVVLDEAQNLSHAENSPSGMILTEGRKFGWSAWYATQSLKILNDDEVTRLLQSAFKLYFKPTDIEIVSLAKQLNPNDVNEWRAPLNSLKKGECIVVGNRIQKDGIFRPSRPTLTRVTSFEER